MSETMLLERRVDPEAMTTPEQSAESNPALEIRDGQYLWKSKTKGGGYTEEFRSDAAVREAFSGIPIDTGWFNLQLTCPGVVRWRDGRIGQSVIAFIPPSIHTLEVTNDGSGEPYALAHLSVPLPGMVICGHGHKYWIWAVKTERLDPYQEIFRCPLPNVYQDGAVCWGLLKPEKATANTILNAWELFINSTFNNHFANGRSKKYGDDVRLMLKEVAAANALAAETGSAQVKYPATEDLVRQKPITGATLDGAIRDFFKTGRMPE
jgi:hypothetical protein